MEAIQTSSARIWVDEEGLVNYASRGVASTRDSVAEGMKVLNRITGGRPAPILFDSRGWPAGDPASWVHFINAIETVCSAAAVVVDDESAAKMGSFPTLLDSLMIPFQIFDDADKAREFLRSHEED